MATLQVRTQSFSAIHGDDRLVEDLLFHHFNTIAAIPYRDERDSKRKQLAGVELHGYTEVVIATALEIAAISDSFGSLNYPVHVPVNTLGWPGQLSSRQVGSVDEFVHVLLAELFGIKPNNMTTDTVLLIDPHLMQSAQIDQALEEARNRRLMIFLPTKQVLPLRLMQSVQDGAELLRTDCRNVLLDQGMEEILIAGEREIDVEIMGAGNRLLPTIVGAADTCLHYVLHSGYLKFALRAEYAGQMVTFNSALCDFGRIISSRSQTMAEAVTEYLIKQGIAATNSYPGQSKTSSKESFRTVPLLKEV